MKIELKILKYIKFLKIIISKNFKKLHGQYVEFHNLYIKFLFLKLQRIFSILQNILRVHYYSLTPIFIDLLSYI